MLNSRAIGSGALLMLSIVLFMGLFLWWLNEGRATAPQLLTFTVIWSIAGFYAASQSSEAGLLHGMLAGLVAGILLLAIFLLLAWEQIELPFLQDASYKRGVMLLALCGFWGSIGGLFSDIRRAGKARRAQRRAEQEPSRTPSD